MPVSTEQSVTAARRKAYSYLRFSTPEQQKGDSFRRQTSMAAAYASQHDLDLDEALTFHDKGVSGYRGQNKDAGRLGDFLEAVQVGLVPQGSVLLVEQLDRLSRMVPRKALRVLESIVEAGVSVVTLNDGREYTAESLDSANGGIDLLISLLTFIRANEESATKARRLAQAWEGKRAQAALKPLTSRAPAWLRLEDERFQVLEDRAAVVRRIFAMTLEGVGQHKIAETLNRERVAPWGRGKHWHRSYIAKILANPAVIGSFTPHRMDHTDGRKRRVPLEPLEGYFPAIISQETWAEVQALAAVQGGAPRGRQAAASVSNILARLATCPKCGRSMTRVQKGKKSLPALVCSAAKAGAGCEYRSVRYSSVETRLLQVLPDIIRDREGIELLEDLESEIADLEATVFRQRERIEFVMDRLLDERSEALTGRLKALEADLATSLARLSSLKEQRDISAGPVIGSRIARAIAALQVPEGGELDRAEASLALRSIFKRAVINWPEGTIDLEWIAGGSCRVHYAWTGGAWRGATGDEMQAA